MCKVCNILFLCFMLALFSQSVCAKTEIGQPAPLLQVTELDGKTFDLSALKSKVVIVHFWATWCLSCREEMPVWDQIYQKYHAAGLEMLGLSMDRSAARSKVALMAQQLHFPIAVKNDVEINGFEEPSSLPITYIFDHNAILQYVLTPNDNTPLTEQYLDSILSLLIRK